MPTETALGSTPDRQRPPDRVRRLRRLPVDRGLRAQAPHHDPIPHPVGQQQPSQHGGLSRRTDDIAGLGIFGLDRPDNRAGDRVGVDRQPGISVSAPVISA